MAKANQGDFSGAVAIGTGYAGISAAPLNGLLVQGNVGIGTTSPSFTLDVTGDERISSRLEFGTANAFGGASQQPLVRHKL